MNKYLTLAGAALLLVGAVGTSTPAHAQAATSGPFQDVPADHWAYAAVNTLQKAGIVIGYPDGTYGGRRPMTRYEFAEAIARLLPQINNIDTSQFAKASDLQAFETDTDAKLASDEAALAALKALVDEFQPELTKMGADVAAMRARLDADENRLAAVEAEQKRVKITGDANFIFRDNINTNGHAAAPLDEDGNASGPDNSPASAGFARGLSGRSTSAWANPQFYNDVLLTIDGKVSDTSDVIVKLDATNYFNNDGSSFSGSSSSFGGGSYDVHGLANVNAPDSAGEALTVFRAYYDTPVNIGIDSAADLQVGRLDEQFTPYTLKAEDVDSYVKLPEDDNGNVSVDGAKLNFAAGGVKANIYAGKTPLPFLGVEADNASASNFGLRPGSLNGASGLGGGFNGAPGGLTGILAIDQSAGAHVTFGVSGFNIGVTGVLARISDPSNGGLANGVGGQAFDMRDGKPIDTLGIYGANINGTFPGLGGLGVDAEFAISQTGDGSEFGNINSTGGNEAWNANLAYTLGPVGLKAGYEQIFNNFTAPGYWGHIGSWTNPVNVEGAVLSASYAATPALNITASGNILQGIDNTAGFSPLGSKDDLDSFKVDAKYNLNNAYDIEGGYEWVQWNLKNDRGALNATQDFGTPGKATEGYTTIGVGHSFTSNATLKLLYQIVNFGAGKTGTTFDPAGSTNGGVAVSQLEVKF